MLKQVLQLLLFASVVLAIGQIPLGGRGTLGANYIYGLKCFGSWTVEKAMQTKFLAGMQLPKSFESWLMLKNLPQNEPVTSIPVIPPPVNAEETISAAKEKISDVKEKLSEAKEKLEDSVDDFQAEMDERMGRILD